MDNSLNPDVVFRALRNAASVLAALVVAGASFASAQRASAEPRSPGWAVAGVPLPFVETGGDSPGAARYHVRAADRTVLFKSGAVQIRLVGEHGRSTVDVRFVGAASSEPFGEDQTEAVISYFVGPRDRWRTGLRTYERVRYADVWPGIDVVYRMDRGRLKYDVIVGPGADPSDVRFEYEGVSALERTPDGGLRLVTPAGMIEERPPVAFQAIDGERHFVAVRLDSTLRSEDGRATVGFEVGRYDRSWPLVIDPPILVYCGYVGGSKEDESVNDIAVDSQGYAYITGWTSCTESTFPVRIGPDLTHNSLPPPPYNARMWDAYVAKVDRSGRRLVYCGYIGGYAYEEGTGIAVDAKGAAYVAGWTASLENNFPVVVGPSLTLSGGSGSDAFVAKVSPDGTKLEYCGYIGGNSGDGAADVAIDARGAAYVTGTTLSDENTLPVRVGPFTKDPSPGQMDAFVAKVRPDGSGLDYCGYIGGLGGDAARAIAVDRNGAAYIAGDTTSNESSFPVRVGPDLTFNSQQSRAPVDGFIAKVKPDGSGLDYCGYIGGDRGATIRGVAVDRAGRAYVGGSTISTEATFPVAVGPDLTHNSPGTDSDAFIGRLRADGTGFEYRGFLGGRGGEGVGAIAVDAGGRLAVVGSTNSPDFPVVRALYSTIRGFSGAFVARVDERGTALQFSTFFGGDQGEDALGVAIDPLGNNIYFTGRTRSDERTFPVRVGPDLTFNDPLNLAWIDPYVAKITVTELTLSGASQIGRTMTLDLMDEAGLAYQLASSLGAGPTWIGRRPLGLAVDPLFVLSLTGAIPNVFTGYAGVLDANGRAQATVRIPRERALVGFSVHSAFVTFRPSAPQGVASVSNSVTFPITQ